MKSMRLSKFQLFIITFVFLLISVSLGFSYINSNISSNNTVTLKKVGCEQNNLYDRLSCMAIMDDTKSKYVSNNLGIDFMKESSDTNGKGLYTLSSTLGSQYPIHYFRGNINNNNVKFANYCWKIVRTTDTGGIKMIYNGTPTNGSCNNTGEAAQLTKKPFNKNDNSLRYVGYMYGDLTNQYSSLSNPTGIFGNSVTYADGEYTLNTTAETLDNNHHYSCGDTATTCSKVRYYYYKSDGVFYYVELSDGKIINDDFFNENFSNDIIDDEGIKYYIENDWYKNNMTNFKEMTEDTVYCNDRSIYQKNGWDPNGGDLAKPLYYGAYGRRTAPSLTCEREADRCSVSSDIGNGKLTYPVGLLTMDEMLLAGAKYSLEVNFYLNTGASYWIMSPIVFEKWESGVAFILQSGGLHYHYVFSSVGVRPVISLKNASAIIASGDGSADSPYVIQE